MESNLGKGGKISSPGREIGCSDSNSYFESFARVEFVPAGRVAGADAVRCGAV